MKLPMTKDTVRFMCWMAANDYGSPDSQSEGMFNSAGFSQVWSLVSKHPILDGEIVRLILIGRPYIEDLKDGYWRLLEE